VLAAERLRMGESTLSKWKAALTKTTVFEAAFPGKGYLKPQDAEIKRLQKKLEKPQRERDILKKAMACVS